MYLMDVTIDDVKKELSSNHTVANNKYIQATYNFVREKHKNHKRKNDEFYIRHLLRVAKSIAEWGFESDVVCAALLHDSVNTGYVSHAEIENTFGSEISNILSEFYWFEDEYQKYTDGGVDLISKALFKHTLKEEAFYIAIADRLDNLNTLSSFTEEEQLHAATRTRDFFIPLLKKEGAFYLVNIFEDLCFKIEHKEKYEAISSKYKKMLSSNAYTLNHTIKLFEESFSAGSLHLSESTRFYLDFVIKFKEEERSTISIYRQLLKNAESMNLNLCDLMDKNTVPLYDLTLVISDEEDSERDLIRPNDLKPMDIFFNVFKEVLTKHNICIEGTKETSYGDTSYLILKDDMNNHYRLFIKTNTEYLGCQLGHLIEKDNFKPGNIHNKSNNTITVFTSKGEARSIEEGATLLDFAFSIHSFLGHHFDYALVNGSKVKRKPGEKIYAGYEITIFTKPEINPDYCWIKYANIDRTTDYLVKYFNSKEAKYRKTLSDMESEIKRLKAENKRLSAD